MPIADVINGYRLFLGREPETERVAQDKAGLPLPKMLSTFVGSREFSERALRSLASGYPLLHFRVSAFPNAEMIAWTRDVLPVGGATREKLGRAKTWRELLTHIVCDPDFTAKFGRVANDELLPMVRKRQGLISKHREREIAGWVDDTSMYEIRGWAANLIKPDEPLTLEFFLDNLFVGTTATTEFRRDVQEKIGGGGHFGFAFNVPAAHHPDLQSEKLLTVRDAVSRMPIAFPVRIRLGQTEALDSLLRLHREVEAVASSIERLQAALPIVLAQTEYPIAMYDAYQKASRKALMVNRLAQAAEAAAFAYSPSISVVLFGVADAPSRLITSLNSLRRQTYRNWECVICVRTADDELRAQVEALCAADSRIKTADLQAESTPWDVANTGLRGASGEYIAFLREGDLFAEDALFEVARALQEWQAPFVYFDEDLFAREGGKVRYLAPVLKTAYDHEHLLSTNYIGNAFVCRRTLLHDAGGFTGDFERSYEYDALLRMIERLKPAEISYLPRILYHRLDNGDAQDGDGSGGETSARRVACVDAHLKRIAAPATAEPHADPFGVPQPRAQRIVWELPQPAPKISIIIPTRDRADLLGPCLQSVFDSQAHYPEPYEVIVMDNESCEPETQTLFERVERQHGARIIPYRAAFNWSAINNLAAREATGDILLFLNNDTRVLSEDWVRELAAIAARPEVGAVGARLLYEDGTIQHGGVVLGGRAVHEGIAQRPGEGGYLGRTALLRNVSAVTGACLATRKELFLELGGFDETALKVAFNDVDYCLKVRAAGLSVIYTPFATLYHFESKSRGLDDDFAKRLRSQSEITVMRTRWKDALDSDPFYNPRFNRTGRPFTRLRPQQLLTLPPGSHDDEHELWEHE
ncbi:MAG: glycosyltransferase family 2 protein [Alphaproteobacteria bacterium]|nr:glycosyltransferase family 2 protein [Alphaproteobacteria bacterium]